MSSYHAIRHLKGILENSYRIKSFFKNLKVVKFVFKMSHSSHKNLISYTFEVFITCNMSLERYCGVIQSNKEFFLNSNGNSKIVIVSFPQKTTNFE